MLSPNSIRQHVSEQSDTLNASEQDLPIHMQVIQSLKSIPLVSLSPMMPIDTLFSPFHQQNNFPFMELVSPMDSMQADPASAFETIGPYLKSAAQRVSQIQFSDANLPQPSPQKDQPNISEDEIYHLAQSTLQRVCPEALPVYELMKSDLSPKELQTSPEPASDELHGSQGTTEPTPPTPPSSIIRDKATDKKALDRKLSIKIKLPKDSKVGPRSSPLKPSATTTPHEPEDVYVKASRLLKQLSNELNEVDISSDELYSQSHSIANHIRRFIRALTSIRGQTGIGRFFLYETVEPVVSSTPETISTQSTTSESNYEIASTLLSNCNLLTTKFASEGLFTSSQPPTPNSSDENTFRLADTSLRKDDMDSEELLLAVERQLNKFGITFLSAALSLSLIHVASHEKSLKGNEDHKKRLWSEEHLSSIIFMLKSHVELTLVPLKLLTQLDKDDIHDSVSELHEAFSQKSVRKAVDSVVEDLSAVLKELVSFFALQQQLDDQTIIPLVYAIIPIYFEQGQAVNGGVSLNSLLPSATDILTSIFSRYDSHRSFIIEEIVSNISRISHLSKRAVPRCRLSNGRGSVAMTSALLFQLIQSATLLPNVWGHSVPRYITAVACASETPDFDVMTGTVKEFKNGWDACANALHNLVQFLLRRTFSLDGNSSASKKEKASKRGGDHHEQNYRVLFEGLLKDAITALGSFEFPVVEQFLLQLCHSMNHVIDDPKHETQVHVFALDVLSEVCAKIFSLKTIEAKDPLKSLDDEVVLLKKLNQYRDEEPKLLHKTAIDFGNTRLFREAFYLMSNEQSDNVSKEQIKDIVLKQFEKPSSFLREDIDPALDLSTLLSKTILQNRHSLILVISKAVNSGSVAIRTKAIKGLHQVTQADPSVLTLSGVSRAVLERTMDSSASVREAALELVGRSLVDAVDTNKDDIPKIITDTFPIIQERVMDISVAVRKRMIRLMKDLFVKFVLAKQLSTTDHVLFDIPFRILSRLSDEEETVIELAYKSFLEIFFSQGSSDFSSARAEESAISDWNHLTVERKQSISMRAFLLSTLFGSEISYLSPLKEFLNKLRQHIRKSEKESSHAIECRRLMMATMEYVREHFDKGQKEEAYHGLIFLHELSASFPAYLEEHLISLKGFLTSSLTDDFEQRLCQIAAKIIALIVTNVVTPDVSILLNMEQDLIALLNKGSQLMLEHIVPCLCAIVKRNRKSAFKLERIVARCLAEVKRAATLLKGSKGTAIPQAQVRTMCRCVILLCLVQRFYDFSDRTQFSSIYEHLSGEKTLLDTTYDLMSSLLLTGQLTEVFQTVCQSGFQYICLGKPSLLLNDASLEIIESWLMGSSIKTKQECVRMFTILLAEEQAHQSRLQEQKSMAVQQHKNAKPTDIDANVLMGRTDENAEAGIHGSLIQRFIQPILACLLNTDSVLTESTMSLVMSILEQGLVHPLTCAPSLCAIATSRNPVLSAKAEMAFKILADKYADFIFSKSVEAVRLSYEYHRRFLPQKDIWVLGYNEMDEEYSAKMAFLYEGLRAKKVRRNEFLKGLVKVFDTNLPWADLNYYTFVADNLATLPYKNQEEIFLLVHHIQGYLSIHGDHLASQLSYAEQDSSRLIEYTLSAFKTYVLLSLKTFLQQSYSLSEAKCLLYNPGNPAKQAEKPLVRPASNTKPWNLHESSLLKLKILRDGDMDSETASAICQHAKEAMNLYLTTDAKDDSDMDDTVDNTQVQTGPQSVAHAVDVDMNQDSNEQPLPEIIPSATTTPIAKGKRRKMIEDKSKGNRRASKKARF